MINLLRMDLYRARKSRSLYVCFAILQIMAVIAFALFWLMCTPQGQKVSGQIGMLALQELQEAKQILEDADTLLMFRQIAIDGGMYNVLFGIWVMLFVCMDYQSGFIKNIMALHQNRWSYIGSKMITAAVVNFFFLTLHCLAVMLINWLFGSFVAAADVCDILFYLSWAWLVTTAFASLVIFICVLTRSVAAGALAVVLLGSGIVMMPLYGILNMFHIGKWLEHSIYMTLCMGPGRYEGIKDLAVYATGGGFVVLYTAVSGVILKRQDI